jgi:hypothetical protein
MKADIFCPRKAMELLSYKVRETALSTNKIEKVRKT